MGELLLGFLLLFLLVSPVLALVLPITNGSRTGWLLWLASVIGAIIRWRAYVNANSISYTIADTIDYNAKKPSFAFEISLSSISVFSVLALVLVNYFSFERSLRTLTIPVVLALGVLTYYGTLEVVAGHDWGQAHCRVVKHETGDSTCEENN